MNVHGLDAGDAIVDPDPAPVEDGVIGSSLGVLGVLVIEELHKRPILDDSLGHGKVAIGRVLLDGEQPLQLSLIPEIGRQVVDIHGLGMEAAEGNVRRVEPITVESVEVMGILAPAGHRPAVEKVTGLSGRVARHVLDQAVAFAFTCEINHGLALNGSHQCQRHSVLPVRSDIIRKASRTFP